MSESNDHKTFTAIMENVISEISFIAKGLVSRIRHLAASYDLAERKRLVPLHEFLKESYKWVGSKCEQDLDDVFEAWDLYESGRPFQCKYCGSFPEELSGISEWSKWGGTMFKELSCHCSNGVPIRVEEEIQPESDEIFEKAACLEKKAYVEWNSKNIC